MKKILSALVIAVVVFSGCSKDTKCTATDSTVVAPASEIANVQAYLNANNILGTTQHSSGFFYKITSSGSGTVVANLCSAVTVTYVGKLANGTTFDPAPSSGVSVSTATFNLSQVITGFQKGVPLIAKGGHIILYIPPSLGYGPNAVGSIPANSILIFDIDLVDVINQ